MIEESLRTALVSAPAVAAIVNARIYPVVAEDTAATPYITYMNASSTRAPSMSAPGTLRNARIQIDCWAATYAQAKALAAAVRAAVEGSAAFKAVLLLEQDGYESQTKTHRQLIEFSIWATES